MNHINKLLQKKFGFYFVVPSKYDLINFLSGVLLGLLIYALILVHFDWVQIGGKENDRNEMDLYKMR